MRNEPIEYTPKKLAETVLLEYPFANEKEAYRVFSAKLKTMGKDTARKFGIYSAKDAKTGVQEFLWDVNSGKVCIDMDEPVDISESLYDMIKKIYESGTIGIFEIYKEFYKAMQNKPGLNERGTKLISKSKFVLYLIDVYLVDKATGRKRIKKQKNDQRYRNMIEGRANAS